MTREREATACVSPGVGVGDAVQVLHVCDAHDAPDHLGAGESQRVLQDPPQELARKDPPGLGIRTKHLGPGGVALGRLGKLDKPPLKVPPGVDGCTAGGTGVSGRGRRT